MESSCEWRDAIGTIVDEVAGADCAMADSADSNGYPDAPDSAASGGQFLLTPIFRRQLARHSLTVARGGGGAPDDLLLFYEPF